MFYICRIFFTFFSLLKYVPSAVVPNWESLCSPRYFCGCPLREGSATGNEWVAAPGCYHILQYKGKKILQYRIIQLTMSGVRMLLSVPVSVLGIQLPC